MKQEGLVLLLDVGPAMHSVLPDVEKACSLLLQKKVKIFLSFLLKFLVTSLLWILSFIAFGFGLYVAVDLQQV